MKMKFIVCSGLLLLSLDIQAGCVPGRNICNILGEPAARAFDAQQARMGALQEQQREAVERQNELLKEQTEALQRANDIQEKEYAEQETKAAMDAKIARVQAGTASYYEDGNGVYCAFYGRCNSEALHEKWIREHK